MTLWARSRPCKLEMPLLTFGTTAAAKQAHSSTRLKVANFSSGLGFWGKIKMNIFGNQVAWNVEFVEEFYLIENNTILLSLICFEKVM